ADRADPVLDLLVVQAPAEGVPGVGREGDEGSLAQALDDLSHGTGLGVVRVDFDEGDHGPTLGAIDDTWAEVPGISAGTRAAATRPPPSSSRGRRPGPCARPCRAGRATAPPTAGGPPGR